MELSISQSLVNIDKVDEVDLSRQSSHTTHPPTLTLVCCFSVSLHPPLSPKNPSPKTPLHPNLPLLPQLLINFIGLWEVTPTMLWSWLETCPGWRKVHKTKQVLLQPSEWRESVSLWWRDSSSQNISSLAVRQCIATEMLRLKQWCLLASRQPWISFPDGCSRQLQRQGEILVSPVWSHQWLSVQYFSRDATAKDLVRTIKECVSIFGIPEHFYSDDGPKFRSETLQSLFKTLGVREQRVCSAYHPRSNLHSETAVKSAKRPLLTPKWPKPPKKRRLE